MRMSTHIVHVATWGSSEPGATRKLVTYIAGGSVVVVICCVIVLA
jgi:hypothetical protein